MLAWYPPTADAAPEELCGADWESSEFAGRGVLVLEGKAPVMVM